MPAALLKEDSSYVFELVGESVPWLFVSHFLEDSFLQAYANALL